VDVLLSLTSLGYKPPESWTRAALVRIQHGFTSSSSSSSQSAALVLPPAELQQQFWSKVSPAGVAEAGLLLPATDGADSTTAATAGAAAAADQAVSMLELPSADELQQLQNLFAAADAEEEASSSSTAAAEDAAVEQPQQQQQALSSSLPNRLPQQQQQEDLDIEQLGVLCWCLGRLEQHPQPQFMQQLSQQLLQHCAVAPVEVVVDSLLGCVSLGYLPVGQLQQQLLARAVELAPSMRPEALRRLCQAAVMLEQGLASYAAADSADLVSAAAEEVEQQQTPGRRGRGRSRQRSSRTATAATISSSVYASAAAVAAASLQQYQQQQLPQLADAVTHRQGIILWQSTTQQLADVFAFIAASGLKPSPEYMATGVSRAVERLAEGAPATSVVTLLWGCARLGFKPHPQLLHQLLAALQRGLHLLSSQDLADVGWALCTLKHRPGSAWLGMYMQQVVSKAAYMPAQALTDTLWALACFAAEPDREWLKRVLLAAGKLQLSNRNAAVMLWALQQLGFQPQSEGWGLQQGAAGEEVQRAVVALLDGVLQPGDEQQQQQQQLVPAG
jgi:hypothetical protein